MVNLYYLEMEDALIPSTTITKICIEKAFFGDFPSDLGEEKSALDVEISLYEYKAKHMQEALVIKMINNDKKTIQSKNPYQLLRKLTKKIKAIENDEESDIFVDVDDLNRSITH